MKTIVSTIFMLGFCLIMMLPLYARTTLVANPSPEQMQIEKAYHQFLSTINGDDLRQFILTWTNESVWDKQSYMLLLLLLHTSSPKLVGIPRDIDETHHDLSLEGGRCAWALEQLLDVNLPPVTQHSLNAGDSQVGNIAFEAFKQIDMKYKAFELLLIKSALPASQEKKLALVEDPTVPIPVITALAHDTNSAVRLAVAHHRDLDIHSLNKLADDDPDPTVRKAASEELKYARTVLDKNWEKRMRVKEFLSVHTPRTLIPSQAQPVILPFDLGIKEHLTKGRSTWRALQTVRTDESGPQTLAEAVNVLVKILNLSAPPAFCTENAHTFYCSASTSLEPGADLTSGFAIRKGETTIYSWETPQK